MVKQGAKAAVPKLRFPEFSAQLGFEVTTVGSLARTVSAGGTPDTSEKSYWGGEIWWMNSGELNLKRVYGVQGRITKEGLRNSSTKKIPAHSVLIGLAGQGKTRGTVAMNMVPLCINQSIAAIYPNEDVFVSDFLYHNLDSRYDELRSLSAGGEGRGGLNLQIIKNLKVLAPGLAEQRKIADCLTSLDDVIAAQGRKVEALKAHKRGLMQQLFPREGEARPRLRFPEFRDAPVWMQQALDVFIEEFSEKSTVQDEHEVLTSARSGLIRQRDYYDNDRITERDNIGFNVIPPNYMTYRSRSDDRRFFFNENDLGITGIISTYYPVFRMRGGNKFFIELLSQNAELVGKRSVGTSQTVLSLNELRRLTLPVPGVEEQERLANCFCSLDIQIVAETNQLAALKTHKRGLMQQLFPAPGGG